MCCNAHLHQPEGCWAGAGVRKKKKRKIPHKKYLTSKGFRAVVAEMVGLLMDLLLACLNQQQSAQGLAKLILPRRCPTLSHHADLLQNLRAQSHPSSSPTYTLVQSKGCTTYTVGGWWWIRKLRRRRGNYFPLPFVTLLLINGLLKPGPAQ